MPRIAAASGRSAHVVVPLLALGLLLFAAGGRLLTAAQAPEAPGSSRQRPPVSFACSPNNLTSYTGVVLGFRRAMGSTTLDIRTDWETTERVVIRHPGTDDPSAFFRVDGKPFRPEDWPSVEQRKGVVRKGVRAAAWVCTDGQVLVHWGVPKE